MVFTLCKYNSGLQYIKFINYVFIKSLLHRINVMLHHLFMGYMRDWCFGKDLSLCLSTYGFIRLFSCFAFGCYRRSIHVYSLDREITSRLCWFSNLF